MLAGLNIGIFGSLILAVTNTGEAHYCLINCEFSLTNKPVATTTTTWHLLLFYHSGCGFFTGAGATSIPANRNGVVKECRNCLALLFVFPPLPRCDGRPWNKREMEYWILSTIRQVTPKATPSCPNDNGVNNSIDTFAQISVYMADNDKDDHS